MKKRIVGLLLGLVVALGSMGALAGCKPKEEYDFTVWVPLVNANVGEYNDHPVFKELENRTKIKVEFVHGKYDELERMFSAGDYYDVMLLNDAVPNGAHPDGFEKALSSGTFLKINDKMETLAPNYTARVKADEDLYRDVVTDAKEMNAFYECTEAEAGAWYGYMMREDWLRDAGWVNEDGSTKLPVTYDDWEQVFTQFQAYNKDNKGKNQPPFFLYKEGVDPFNSISAGYGVTFDFQLDDRGAVQYGPYMDGFKGYLDRMRKWYSSGWIDKEFNKSELYVPIGEVVGKGGKAKYGVFPQMYVSMSQNERLAAKQGNAEYKLIGVPNPRLNADDTLHIRQKSPRGGTYAVITDKCKDPDTAIKWLDYLYSDEGTLLMNYGIEGESYEMVDGKPQYKDIVINNPDYAISDTVKMYSVQGFPMMTDLSRELQGAKENEKAAMDTWTDNNDAAYILPTVSISLEETNEYGKIMASLEKYTAVFIYEYIAGKNTISFEQFRATLKEQGIERAIAIKQSAYDRYKARV